MSLNELLAEVRVRGIQLQRSGEELVLRGSKHGLDSSIVKELRFHKTALLELISSKSNSESWPLAALTPDMLPLVELSQEEINQIVAAVPGGARNVQDIYPLAPLQEGILFHYLLGGEGDPYLLVNLVSFDQRKRMEGFLKALQAVIDRHDILRTGVVWEGLGEAVQVVWREAPLLVEEVELEEEAGEAAEQLYARFHPSRYRIDVRQAPMLRAYMAEDVRRGRWLLLLLLHHLAGDHTTLGVMREEVQAHLLGEAGRLPGPLPFRNLVAQARLGMKREEHEAFFRQMLGDVEEGTLPFGLVEVQGDGSEVGEERVELEEELGGKLREWSRKLGVSAASICHVAWACVVAKTSGREDVVFGTVLFGRMQGGAGADRVMGLYINTLPVRIKVGEQGVKASIGAMQRMLGELLRHEHASLTLAQRCSGVPASVPLFSALLNYRHSPKMPQGLQEKTRQAGEGMEWLRGESRTNYPVTLSVDDLGEGFRLTTQTVRGIDPRRVCAYMRTALESLVEALEAEPDREMRRVEVLPAWEQEQILYEWNRTEHPYPDNKCVHELFAERTSTNPGAIALEYDGQRWTYGELNRRANQVAHYLRRLGAGPETNIAVCLERSADLVMVLLGILKTGAAYVPLELNYPAERLKYMLEDSRAKVVVTRQTLLARLPAYSGAIVRLDDEEGVEIDRESVENVPSLAVPDNLAYVIHTSGSTGTPKGIGGTHRGVVNRIAWMAHAWPMSVDEICCQKTSVSFVDSVTEIFAPLLAGIPLMIASDDVAKDAAELNRFLEKHGVTRIVLVPSMLRTMLSTDLGAARGLEKLQTVVTSGETLPTDLANLFKDVLPHAALLNLYGSSEVAADATWADLTQRRASDPVLIGRPIANMHAYVLDSDMRPSAIGITGELHVGGVGLARGYVNRSDLTAERFVPDPFSRSGGDRLYRTGDLVRWHSTGELEFIGRKDFQVKVRGHRVELGEIEAALSADPSIEQAVVMARQDDHHTRLVAYMTFRRKTSLTALREALRQRVPEYMLPSDFVVLEAFPLTHSGKVDRRALPAPVIGSDAAESGDIVPRTPVEELLAQIWSDVLKVKNVGIHDHFFNLGGQSLLATQVVARVTRGFGVPLQLRHLFDTPTIAGLANQVELLLKGGKKDKTPPLVHRPGERVVPLSYAQQRLWFIEQVAPGPAYNLPVAVRIRGQLDLASFQNALKEMMRRHASLRTRFILVEGEARQIVDDEVPLELPIIDLGAYSEDERESQIKRLADEEGHKLFDLRQNPLLQTKLLRVAEDHHVLLATMHHIISDAWSMTILVTEISLLYQSFVAAQPVLLPELPIQYTDYSLWQRNWMSGAVLEEKLEYWRKQLAGMERLDLPVDRLRPAIQTANGANFNFTLPAELTNKLKELARREGVTLYMLLLAALMTLLYRYSRQTDVAVGSPIAGRTQKETERLIGFFVNMLVLRADLTGQPGFTEVLRRVKEVTLGAYAHQEAPFERLVEEFEPNRDISRTPLFQVAFVLQNMVQPHAPASRGITLEFLSVENGTAKFDLTLGVIEGISEMQGVLQYNTDLFERTTIVGMAERFQHLLSAIIETPGEKIDALPLISAGERRSLIQGWSGAPHLGNKDTICDRVRVEAEKNGEAIALLEEGAELRYGDLNRRVNQVAHGLVHYGVTGEERVGICLNKGMDWIVASLGVLKAGAVIVPLDPTELDARLKQILQDASVRTVVTGEKLRQRFEQSNLRSIGLEEFEKECSEEPGTNLKPDALACIFYQPSPTGMPRGVLLNQRALCACTSTDGAQIMAGDRVAQRIDLSREVGGLEVFRTLAAGACVVSIPGGPLAPRQLATILRDHAATVLWIQAPVLRQLARKFPRELKDPRLIFCEDPIQDVGPLATALKQETVVRLYGIHADSEMAGCGPIYHLPEVDADVQAIALNRLPEGMTFHLLDQNFEPVPQGLLGEIYVGGESFAHGYNHQPEKSAETFVADPYSEAPGRRLYRTGELGRRRNDGRLELRGRRDGRVRIGGQRAELKEVEAALMQHPAVKEAVVLMQENAQEPPALSAFVVAAEGMGITAGEGRQFLLQHLPERLIPANFYMVDAVPRSASERIDHRLLMQKVKQKQYAVPKTRTEEILCGIWAKLLHVEQVGIHDNFFTLGGDSILSIQVITQAAQAGIQLTPRQVFERQTIAELAEVARIVEETDAGTEAENNGNQYLPSGLGVWGPEKITPEILPLVELSQEEIDGVMAAVPGGAKNVQDIYPLAPLQEGILFHYLLGGEGDPYLLVNLVSFDQRQRMENFLRALQAVIDRHDILRTGVAWEGLSEPVQVVWREARLPVEEVGLEEEEEGGDAAEQLYARFHPSQYRIDVRQAPMLRAYMAEDVKRGRWLLLLLLHHLAGDHTTLEVIQEEIQAHLLGEGGRLPEPLPFRNLVVQARLGVKREEHEAFFRQMLGDVEEGTLPFGLVDVQGSEGEIREERVELEEKLGRKLREWSRKLGVSAASLCHVAWACVVAKTSGREDVVFGTVLFGRMQGGAGADRVMGLYINTLPVRMKVGEQGVEASIREMQRMLGELLGHEHASLALVQRCSGVPAAQPLFSALLNYRHSPKMPKGLEERARRAGEGMEWLRGQDRSNYPVGLSVDDWGEGFRLTAQTVGGIDPKRICAYMAKTLESVVEALEVEPGREVRRVEILPVWEREKILQDWSGRKKEYAEEKCVHELFEAQVERTPEALAAEYAGEQLTYRELNQRANQLAHYLANLGVGPEVRVGIFAERGVFFLTGILGILKAGGAYLPLDSSLPVELLETMLMDAQISIVLTQDSMRDVVTSAGGLWMQVLSLDGDSEQFASESLENPRTKLSPDNLAYVMYTSGSTGRPKGISILHQGIVRLVVHAGYVQLNQNDRIAQIASTSFDAATFEIWGALLNGGCVVVLDRETSLNPAKLQSAIRVERISTMFLTTALFNQIARESKEAFRGLRYLLVGGDVVDPHWVEAVFNHKPQHFLNGYGPTEMTTFTTSYEVLDIKAGTVTVPIGSPISNNQVYVLDEWMQLLPVGAMGELYAGGTGLARGYLNNPELTAEKFVPNPFSTTDGDRLYRTGDRVRWRTDGELEFMGRVDYQVKLRGYRIELGEIESALAKLAMVGNVAVLMREDRPGDKQLVAYVAVGERIHEDGLVEDLKNTLRQKLPEYMVPSHIVLMDSLPLTRNGKIDRKMLPVPRAEDSRGGGDRSKARSPVEELIVPIWEEVLDTGPISVTDNFFALGGHSLLATQIVVRMNSAFRLDIPLRLLFEYPTIVELGRKIEELMVGGTCEEEPPIERVPREQFMPLSYAQQRLWFIDQLEPGVSTYNIPAALRIQGRIDGEALERTFREIVRRHEPLRTRFALVDGEPRQIIDETYEFQLPQVNVTAMSPSSIEQEAKSLAWKEARLPFDLKHGPLIRVRLLHLADEDHVLLLTMHHIVFDGWSIGILLREVSALYAAFRAGQPSPLEELPIQYVDYSAWQRKWLHGHIMDRQLEYWKQQLAGVELLELPTDRPRSAIQSHNGDRIKIELPSELTDKIKALAQAKSATLYMTLLAAFQVLLHRYSGQESFATGLPVAGRVRAETEGLIGFFVNTLTLRSCLSGQPTFSDLLQRVKKTTLEAYAHQDVPFEKLVEELHTGRHPGRTPLFQAVFVLQNAPLSDLELGTCKLLPFSGAELSTAKFDLTLDLWDLESGVRGALEYNTDLFDSCMISRMLTHYQVILSVMVARPEQAISEFSILTEEERQQLVVNWNPCAEGGYPGGNCVHELFAEQVRRTPEAVAIEYEAQWLTYRELDRRANQLANYLSKLGVGPEIKVGICMGRSLDLVIALLAVLKAGGAYLPLDPSYPDQRLRYMGEDSVINVVIAHQSTAARFTGCNIRVICPALEVAEISRNSDVAPQSVATPDNLAYVIYTSGSTGLPKAVGVAHRGVVRLVCNCNFADLSGARKFLQFAPIAFDASVLEIWGCLLNGGTLAMFTAGNTALADLADFIQCKGIDTAWLTAGLFHQILETAGEKLKEVRQLFVGGDVVSPAWARRALQNASGQVLINGYGPTENTTFTACYRMEKVEDIGPSSLPIGKPISNTQVYVLNEKMELVPIGVPGELYTGGDGLARGYLNSATLTAEKFVPNPFPQYPGARLYRTGDLVRWTNGENLEFIRRLDYQVKVRGHRVELEEIECVMKQIEGVDQAVVIARETQFGEKQLIAYVVMHEGTTVGKLREKLKKELPDYMQPAHFVKMEAFPLTSNGKIDRQALPPLSTECIQRKESYVAPASPMEKELAKIWNELLGLEQVSIHDDFFEIGGHSLLAVRLRSLVVDRLKCDLALRDLFRASTIADLAALLEQPRPQPSSTIIVEIQPHGSRIPFFAVHPAGGNVFCYADLARELGPEQPFVGLQAPAAGSLPQGIETFEQLAEFYIQAIRTIQPSGPYLLGGWSLGGLLAWEIAQQLSAQGETIGLLALIDTHPFTKAPENQNAGDLPILPWFALDMARLLGKNAEEMRHRFLQLKPKEQWQMVENTLIEYGVVPLASSHVETARLLEVFERNFRAMEKYSLHRTKQRVLLFAASEKGAPERLAREWEQWAGGGAKCELVPGDHYTMLQQPNVVAIARVLRNSFNDFTERTAKAVTAVGSLGN